MSPDYEKQVSEYWNSSVVRHAFQKFDEYRPEIIDEWKKMALIYAPSGKEVLRADYLVKKFKEYGIANAHIDDSGNAVALIDRGEGPTVAILGTMDDLATVADLVKTYDKPILEEDGKLIGPGTHISATLSNILVLAKLLLLPEVQFKGKVYLVGVVQEETGLIGIKGFLRDHPGEIDYVIDIMAGIGRMSYGGIGIHWFKLHFKGPKAHTLRGPGPNVTKGVAKAVPRIFAIPLPENSFLNISMLGAGKVFNHRSDDGWLSIDLRSIENHVINEIKEKIKKIADEVAAEEELEAWIEPVVETPAGQIPGARDSPLVRVAEEVVKVMGYKPTLSNRGSCNMNVGVAQGVLSISTGGDRGGARDSLESYANIEPVMQGAKWVFLTTYILTSGTKE
jgi:acetylornithine deacetylase/succinyl-diaminopimelate desuccinylase-like protein